MFRDIETTGGAPFNPPHVFDQTTQKCACCGMTLNELIKHGGPLLCPVGRGGLTRRADRKREDYQRPDQEEVVYEVDHE